jgi:acetolactate synthase-1/2/3 large subunit
MVEKPAHTDIPASVSSERPLEGGDLLIRALHARGVQRVFSVSGGPINSVYNATLRSEVALCHTRHESAAGFMADATTRVTGVPGVAIVTLGPGVTNCVTPGANALRAGVPMLVVGGQTATGQLDREAPMVIDGVAAMTPVTKWAARVLTTDRIPEYVDEAWRRMTSGRPGPVYLEIPVDVLSAPAEAVESGARATRFVQAPPSADALAAVESALMLARRPLLLAGDDVFFSGAEDALLACVERHRIPFAQLRLARGAVDERHPLSLGAGYTPGSAAIRRAIAEADCILLVGHPWDFDIEFGAGVHPDATLIQVHPAGDVIGRDHPVHIGVAASAAPLLTALAERPARDADEEWARSVTRAVADERETIGARAGAHREDEPMHPVELVDAVVGALPEETIYVTSHGNVDFWADGRIRVPAAGGYLRAGQYGPLGAEVPYGVAAKLAEPGRPVVVFVGDGGFAYHGLELETAARYGAPLIVVVADDERWGAIALPQQRAYGVTVEMDLPRREWADVARAIGGHGETVDRPQDVGPALERCLASGLPAVLHARIACVLSPYMDYISE